MRSTKRLFRYLLIAVSALLLILSAALVVSAHPGSTDYKGGHTDRSTGEYHYHHGYSAHAHEDKDGDGVLDCPYDFDDQTDHSYHGDSDSAYYSYELDNEFAFINPITTATPKPTASPMQTEIESGSNSAISFGKVLKALLWSILPAIAFGFFFTYFLSFILMFFDWFEDLVFHLFGILILISYFVLVYLYLS